MNKCKNCGVDTKNKSYCSRSCSASHTNKIYPKSKTKKICKLCDKSVKSYRHTLCEEHHLEYINSKPLLIKDLTLKEYWNRKSLYNLHSSSKNAHIRSLARSWFKHLTIKPCFKCGYNKNVEICHIKPIRDFNDDSKLSEVNSSNNIIQLCPNCHWEFDNGLLIL